MGKFKRFIACIVTLVFCVISATSFLQVSADGLKSYKISAVYDSSLCTVKLTDNYTKEEVENGGYITEDATAKRAYVEIVVSDIADGYRIKSMVLNDVEITETLIKGAYGRLATTITEDTEVIIELEKTPDDLCKIIGGKIYSDKQYKNEVGDTITFTNDSRLYTKIQFDINAPDYFTGCYFEYSTDKVNWIACTFWGNRCDFWAGWSLHDFDFVNTKNYYMRAHLFGRNNYSEGDVYSDIIRVNPTEEKESLIKDGEYIRLGSYYGEPILWRCVYNDSNGSMLISDKQLSMKCYSGGKNLVTGDVITWGDSLWSVADIRSWLNSTENENNVVWADGTAPDENANFGGYNAYHDEAGFLSEENFTSEEVRLIKPVKRKSYLALKDAGRATTGESCIIYEEESNISTLNIDFESIYAEIVEDKVFIPNLEELGKIYENRAILGDTYYYAMPTEIAKEKTECSYRDDWDIWVSQPVEFGEPDGGAQIYTLKSDGSFGWRATCGSDLTGIRPAFYLSDNAEILSGNGTAENPYILEDTTPHTKTVVEKTGEKEQFKVSLNNIAAGTTVVLALYDGNRFVEMHKATYEGENVVFETTEDYTKAKVFAWGDFLSFKPVCTPENVK